MVQRTYYRPEWTCGRYNDNAEVALMYNLIEGKSYFFESYSAMVIGEILSVHKNSEVSIADISGKLDIATESLSPFFEQLEQLGLVSSILPTKDNQSIYNQLLLNILRVISQKYGHNL